MKFLDDRPPIDATATATGPTVEVLFPGAKRRERRLGWLGAIVVIVGAGIYEVVGTGRPSTGSSGLTHLPCRII